MAEVGNTDHYEGEGSRSADIFPWRQQLVVQFPRPRLLAARSLRLPAEVFRKRGKELHISIGQPISVEEQEAHRSIEEFGKFLRQRTYALREIK